MLKILILRFSSIGDIVLTSPVIRCLKTQLKEVEIHFVTKDVFADVLIHNPYLTKLHTFKHDVNEVYRALKTEKFDYVIDLHKNLRSYRLKQKLGVKGFSFNKLNLEKWLAVRLKSKNILPPKHIVDRYLETVKVLNVHNDGKGLDYFIAPHDEVNLQTLFKNTKPPRFIALVTGGSYYTKQIPQAKLREIVSNAKLPIVLLGGKTDVKLANELILQHPELINACGKFSINQSASILRQAEWVITSDTGLMHIASAFGKKIISMWGNTIPEFGMSPYLPAVGSQILEVKGLACRPCSKLGYKKCPKGHFKCMNEIDVVLVNQLT